MSVHDLVLSHLREHSHLRSEEIKLEHTLAGDLRMDGDDFSYLFVPQLEKALGLKTSQEDWDHVTTVGDVIKMLERKVNDRRGGA